MANIYMMGDSTMRLNNYLYYPQTGWGQVLYMFTKPDVLVFDHAENGRSSKSFIDEKRFDAILEQLQEGDFVICQFGHNDEKPDLVRHTEPFTTYIDNLAYYAQKVEEKGATIVYATSITRHKFVDGKCINTHGDYPTAMLEYCKKSNHVCVDLNTLTIEHYNDIGEEKSAKYHMIFKENEYLNYIEGKDDHSHLVYEGALMVARLFVSELSKTNSKLNDLFINITQKAFIDEKMLKD